MDKLDRLDELEQEKRRKERRIREAEEALERIEREPVKFLCNEKIVEIYKAKIYSQIAADKTRIAEILEEKQELITTMRKKKEIERVNKIIPRAILMLDAGVEPLTEEENPLIILREV